MQTACPSFSIQQKIIFAALCRRKLESSRHGHPRAFAFRRATNCLIVSGRSSATFIVGDAPTSAAENDMEDLIVRGCGKSYLYLLRPFRFAKVTNCSDCTIVVSAVRGVLSMQDCHNVTLISCCWQQCISSCHDVVLHTSTPRKPIMLGDNRGITLAPHNAVYPHLAAHLEQAELLGLSSDRWMLPIDLNNSPTRPYKIMSAEDFLPFTVPLLSSATGVISQQSGLPLPEGEYSSALERKIKMVNDIREILRVASSSSSTTTKGSSNKASAENVEESPGAASAEVLEAVQQKFQQWLVSSGNMRQVSDLVSLARRST